MNAIQERRQFKYRSIWISDIHLGTRGCNDQMLLDFLKHTESDYLYLVGDIIDGWRMKRAWYWKQGHNDVVQKLLRKARKGCKMFYIPGNHDESFRDFANGQFGHVRIVKDAVHETVDGKKLWVLHGDQFDGVVKYAKWLAYVGDAAYDGLLLFNRGFNFLRRKLGFSYWSLSAYLKHKVKNAVEFISCFEATVANEARKRKVDGVVCGHIHHAEIRHIDGVLYGNCGDWVESCTAMVEHADGRLEILRWADMYTLPQLENTEECASLSSPTRGILKSMASSVLSIL